MSITLDEATIANIDEVEKSEGGRGLRRILEETIATQREQATEFASLKAEKVLRENGYSSVTPEELATVPVEQIADRAKELHEQRSAQERDVARKLLTRQGLEGSALDEAVEKMLEAPADTQKPNEFGALNEVTQLGGEPVRVNVSELHGVDAIKHGLNKSPA